jgi:hypothetical protein
MGHIPGFGQMGAVDRSHRVRRFHYPRLQGSEQEGRMFQARLGESIRDFHNVFVRHFLFDCNNASPTYQIGDDDCAVFGAAHHVGANFVFGLLDQRHGAHVQNGFGDVIGYCRLSLSIRNNESTQNRYKPFTSILFINLFRAICRTQ